MMTRGTPATAPLDGNTGLGSGSAISLCNWMKNLSRVRSATAHNDGDTAYAQAERAMEAIIASVNVISLICPRKLTWAGEHLAKLVQESRKQQPC
jgi:hypothetical protein